MASPMPIYIKSMKAMQIKVYVIKNLFSCTSFSSSKLRGSECIAKNTMGVQIHRGVFFQIVSGGRSTIRIKIRRNVKITNGLVWNCWVSNFVNGSNMSIDIMVKMLNVQTGNVSKASLGLIEPPIILINELMMYETMQYRTKCHQST